MKKILPVFSYLFHPIFIPLLGTFFYVILDDNYFTLPQYLVLFIQIIIISILLPLAFFYLLRTFGKIDSIMLSDISQRKIPLLLQIMLMSILIAKSITIRHLSNWSKSPPVMRMPKQPKRPPTLFIIRWLLLP